MTAFQVKGENLKPFLKAYRPCFRGLLVLMAVLAWLTPVHSEEEEKTYTIDLVKTAEIGQDKEVRQVEDKKVLTETYTVEEGDHLWQLLREKGLLKKKDLPELLSILKKLNKSLGNLDLIQPGEKIIIPLKFAPVSAPPGTTAPEEEVKTSVASLKDLKLENYTVRPGDSIIRVVQGRFDIPPDQLYNEYLDAVRKLNPFLQDLNTIHPGQQIKLPIFSPKVVRQQIQSEALPKSEMGAEDKSKEAVAEGLGEIFEEMGEEWVQTGQHFIPLKSGGQIDLQASSFPVINLRNGLKVIVDLYHKLPDTMASFIESSWGTYQVVQLSKKDGLKAALEKTLAVCHYPNVLSEGEPLELEGEIPLKITADYIVMLSDDTSSEKPLVVVINLIEGSEMETPWTIKAYLSGIGIKVIDFPGSQDRPSGDTTTGKTEGAMSRGTLVETLLEIAGRPFSTQLDIPVYQSQKQDFKLIVKADFFTEIKGVNSIIDLAGLDPKVISFLKEHQFQVLSLSPENEFLDSVAKTLEFLGIPFENGPHTFLTSHRDPSRNIQLTFSGIVFSDVAGNKIMATSHQLPENIALFLKEKGYRTLFPEGS
jgi:LysM repeat protein